MNAIFRHFPKSAVGLFEVIPQSIENVSLDFVDWKASGTLMVTINNQLPSFKGNIIIAAKVGENKVPILSDEVQSFSALPNSTQILAFEWELQGATNISRLLSDSTFQDNFEYTNTTSGKSKIPVQITGIIKEFEVSQEFNEQAIVPIEIVKIILPPTAKGKKIEWWCADNYIVIDGVWHPRDHSSLYVRYLHCAGGNTVQIVGWDVAIEFPGIYELYFEMIRSKNSGKIQVIIRKPNKDLVFKSKLLDNYRNGPDKLLEFRVNRHSGGTNFRLPEKGTYRFAVVNKKEWKNTSSEGNNIMIHKFTLKGLRD